MLGDVLDLLEEGPRTSTSIARELLLHKGAAGRALNRLFLGGRVVIVKREPEHPVVRYGLGEQEALRRLGRTRRG